MRDLRIVDISDSTIVAVDSQGEEFRLSLDDNQITRLRSAKNDPTVVKVSPKEIQSLIRAGLSPADVSRVTGATAEDITRYEAPVLAEREFVLNSALATLVAIDDSSSSVPFGVLVRDRLENLGATAQRWVSWKDPADGWLVKVEFAAKGVEHDARWSFDARRSTLLPVNDDATTLTHRGDLESGPAPRLRAVDVMTGAIPTVNDSASHTRRIPTSPVFSQVSQSIRTGAINIIPSVDDVTSTHDSAVPESDDHAEDDVDRPSTPTADLLEALRKRRQENDEAPSWLTDARVESMVVPETAVENPISDDVLNAVAIEITQTTVFATEQSSTDPRTLDTDVLDSEPLTDTGRARRVRKTRPTLPAWDNIVFGRPADE